MIDRSRDNCDIQEIQCSYRILSCIWIRFHHRFLSLGYPMTSTVKARPHCYCKEVTRYRILVVLKTPTLYDSVIWIKTVSIGKCISQSQSWIFIFYFCCHFSAETATIKLETYRRHIVREFPDFSSDIGSQPGTCCQRSLSKYENPRSVILQGLRRILVSITYTV